MRCQERYNFRATRVILPLRMRVSGAMCILPTAERTAKYAGGTRGRSNSDKVGRRGLVPRPVRLSTETRAINKAQLPEQLHLCVPAQHETAPCQNCAIWF